MWLGMQTSIAQRAVATTFGKRSLSSPEAFHPRSWGNVQLTPGHLQGNQRAQIRLPVTHALTHCSTLLDVTPDKTEERNCHPCVDS